MRLPTLEAIRDGCEEQLAQYHDNYSQGRLLYLFFLAYTQYNI